MQTNIEILNKYRNLSLLCYKLAFDYTLIG